MRLSVEAAMLLPVLLGAVACNKTSSDDSGVPDSECTDLTWDNYGEGYLRSWCNGCHSSEVSGDGREGAPVGMDFDTYAGLQEHLDRVVARGTGDEPTMPPVGGADDAERERFAEWLDCGAP